MLSIPAGAAYVFPPGGIVWQGGDPMKQTVFIVTEQRTAQSDREARELIQRCVGRWLREALRKE